MRFIVPICRTDRVHMQITVVAKNEQDARRRVEVMGHGQMDAMAEIIDIDDGDYTVGDAVLAKRAK
jgi:hypothetical protein